MAAILTELVFICYGSDRPLKGYDALHHTRAKFAGEALPVRVVAGTINADFASHLSIASGAASKVRR